LIPNLHIIYSIYIGLFLNKNFKTYPGLMLPPDGRNWQLIYTWLSLEIGG
jgi:hypothetical protein